MNIVRWVVRFLPAGKVIHSKYYKRLKKGAHKFSVLIYKYYFLSDGSRMGSTMSWHWPLNSTNSAASNFQPLESMPEIPSNNSSNSISGSTKPLLGETLSMPLLPNYHFSVENNTVVMENTGGGNENASPLQGNLLTGGIFESGAYGVPS